MLEIWLLLLLQKYFLLTFYWFLQGCQYLRISVLYVLYCLEQCSNSTWFIDFRFVLGIDWCQHSLISYAWFHLSIKALQKLIRVQIYTNSFNSFYANFSNTRFQKVPSPHLKLTIKQKFLHLDAFLFMIYYLSD